MTEQAQQPGTGVHPAAPEDSAPPAESAAPADSAAPEDSVAPRAGATRVGRAGRNLGAAIGVGVGLGAVVLVTLALYPPGFALIVAVAVVVALWELVRALDAGDTQPPLVPLLVGALAMLALTYVRGTDGLVVAFMLTVLACLIWRLAEGAVGYLRDVSSTVLIVTYVPLLASFAVLLVLPPDGSLRVLTFIVTVVCSDVGGYAAGVFLGKHPMAPSVSPKKSWEGFAGSAVLSMLAGSLFLTLGFDGRWWQGLLYGLAIAAAATLGDLGESMLKRDLRIKDMGSMLPGHGGLMDRMDSLLPAAVVAWVLLSVFFPVTG